MSEREILEVEVASHQARVEEITSVLRDGREDRETQLLRMELLGRSAAVQLGSARLKMLRD
jgi:hypothetical protein